tara:strand:+ start:212 stop:445 length:234 start_codon:yes stop_codon:yes gene_type:complete
MNDLEKCAKLIKNIKKLIGDDVFDKELINNDTEDIYDYIIEKIYETPSYINEVSFKSPDKIKIAFNKFYHKLMYENT